MTALDLDVVIVTYESAAHLEQCVRSLPAGARIIVIDNASSDGSADLAEELGCEVVRNDQNVGFARAVNQAARHHVHAEQMLLLNPDANVASEDLMKLLDAVTDPTIAAAGPRLRSTDGRDQRPWWDDPSSGLAWREALGLHRVQPPDFAQSADVPFVVGACMLIRTGAFRAVGGFDERYWLYAEEADLCRRFRDIGWRIRYVAEAEAWHLGGASSALNPTSDEHFARGQERFVLTHQGPLALASFRLATAVGSAVRIPLLPHGDDRRTTRARALRRSTRMLVRRPTRPATPEAAIAAPSVVVCSLESWDDVWRRNQFLVRELTDAEPSLRVLFVEPAIDPLHEALTRRRLPRLANAARLRRVPGRPQVTRVKAVKIGPRRMGRWVDRSLSRQVLHAAERAEIVDPTLWLNDLGFVDLLRKSAWPAIYDVTDDWVAASTPGRERRVLVEREGRALRGSGAVVVCSPDLEASRGSTRPVELIANAVDVDHFQAPRERPADLPPGPVAVYVGTLHEHRLDVDLVREVAARLPSLPIVLVGPDALNEASHAALRELDNVHLLGPRPYADVPAYLQHASVVIVPHVVSSFTESLDPIKAYECLAVGRPTLATPVAGFRDLGEPINVAERAQFTATLDRLINDLGSNTSAPRAVPTWEARAHDFAAALGRACDPRTLPLDPPVRVVYLGHTAQLSGGELALSRMLPALIELGVEPHVILAEDGPLVDELRHAGATVEVLPIAPVAGRLARDQVTPGRIPLRSMSAGLTYAYRLARRLRELDPDIVHTNTLKSAVYGGIAGRAAGITVVWHMRDRIETDYLPKPTAIGVRALARFVPNAVIANSRATLETLGHLGSPAIVVPSPVISGATRTRRATPEDGALRVGMVGRISPWKGQHVFLDAFAKAFAGGGAEALVVGAPLFGEEEYETSLHELCALLGIEARVTFTGFRGDVSQLMASLDVLVHASTVPEPFGQVVVEGMAAGLPVIASAAGGPLEVITDEVDGILVEPGDASALARELSRLADDPALRERLGTAGRRRADDFSPERCAGKVTALYARLATQPIEGDL